MKVLDNNELNVNQLDKVTGGRVSSPYSPIDVDRKKVPVKNPLLNNISDSILKPNAGCAEKPFTVCPVCHSTAVSYNREENICMCQDCGYCEDGSK